MICVSLAEATLSTCLATLKRVPFAEIRMDLMNNTIQETRALFSRHGNLIATCRPGRQSESERKLLLIEAIESGAAFVDVELEADPAHRDEIATKARSKGCRLIVSFHDYEKTPPGPELEGIVNACFMAGADIAKVACMVQAERDNARLLGLLDTEKKIVVVGMGKKGAITRVLGPLLGSPFTFASLSRGRETADGQMDRRTMQRLLNSIALISGQKAQQAEGRNMSRRRKKGKPA